MRTHGTLFGGPWVPRDLAVGGGGGGGILSVGDRFCWLGIQLTKNCLGSEAAHPASYWDFFWLIRTAFALRNFLTLTTLGGCTQVFREIAIYWFLEGFGHLGKAGPQPT